MNHQRLLELDALRGLAALGVVGFHYFARYDALYGHENLAVAWSRIGSLGVDLFFMVSGFVIFWTLNKVEKPLDFVVSRFSRLYPVYWCALAITFFAVWFFGLPGREITAFQALGNVLMFQEYLNIPHLDGAYWTLTVELTFYFWMFVLYLRGDLGRVELIFACVILVSLLHSLGVLPVPKALYQIFILKYIPFFTAGICFYRLNSGTGNPRITMGVLLLSLLSTIGIHSLKDFLVFCAFYAVFYLALSGRLRFLSARPFLFLGGISYSWYLLHQNIGYIIINKGYEWSLHPLASIFLAAAITIFFALLLTRYIEGPCLRHIRHGYKNNARIQRLAGKLTLSSSRDLA